MESERRARWQQPTRVCLHAKKILHVANVKSVALFLERSRDKIGNKNRQLARAARRCTRAASRRRGARGGEGDGEGDGERRGAVKATARRWPSDGADAYIEDTQSADRLLFEVSGGWRVAPVICGCQSIKKQSTKIEAQLSTFSLQSHKQGKTPVDKKKAI